MEPGFTRYGVFNMEYTKYNVVAYGCSKAPGLFFALTTFGGGINGLKAVKGIKALKAAAVRGLRFDEIPSETE